MGVKAFLTFLWAAAIIVATCNNDAHAFLFDQIVGFSFNANPNLADLLIINDIDFTDSFYFIQKTGHFLSFALLYVLLFNWLKKRLPAVAIAVAFGVFTEILQMYFERDGRLFDAFIDSLGILLAFVLVNAVVSFKRGAAEDTSY
ncbi:MAG TPA: VanZ family protein [Planococcus sp. (in: firmicutes)]|nr:VanZ family protein [Planococcus sp. (in: firmicutes)]